MPGSYRASAEQATVCGTAVLSRFELPTDVASPRPLTGIAVECGTAVPSRSVLPTDAASPRPLTGIAVTLVQPVT